MPAMLVRLSLANVRRSLRDYAVFFFTLVIGVTLFYAFNAVGSQTAMLKLTAERGRIVNLLQEALTAVSLFVIVVLGLLVVYASRFLMKRRHKEFALYLLLGMDRRKVAHMLLLESAILGVAALGVGLVLGIVVSQVMGHFVGSLLVPDGVAFHFSVSGGAIIKTIAFFAVIYLMVMLLNARSVGRTKLIDLLQSAKRSESIKLKSPVLCVLVFLVACVILGFAYYMVGWESLSISEAALFFYIVIGSIGTFLLIWAVSGLLLRIVMSLQKVYYRGLNSFTFRQVSSKINTVVFSMTVICLMLFFAICALASAFSLQGGMRAGMERCLADFEVKTTEILPSDPAAPTFDDVVERYARYGYNLPSHFSEYVHFRSYHDPSSAADGLGGAAGELVHVNAVAGAIRLSDYNALMALYGREAMDLGEDEFALVCDYEENKRAYDRVLDTGIEVTLFGHTLRSAYPDTVDGFVDLSTGRSNTGVFVVPDDVVDDSTAMADYFIGNYRADTDEQRQAVEEQCVAEHDAVDQMMSGEDGGEDEPSFRLQLVTRIGAADSAMGMGALLAVIGLYIGLVFLVASGAILALRELSDSVDSLPRYETLRKIGADEDEIARSLFAQTAIFFLLPLVLAFVHAVFGMKFMSTYIALAGNGGMLAGTIVTAVIILLVYGGYFALTYRGSLRIIRERAE